MFLWPFFLLIGFFLFFSIHVSASATYYHRGDPAKPKKWYYFVVLITYFDKRCCLGCLKFTFEFCCIYSSQLDPAACCRKHYGWRFIGYYYVVTITFSYILWYLYGWGLGIFFDIFCCFYDIQQPDRSRSTSLLLPEPYIRAAIYLVLLCRNDHGFLYMWWFCGYCTAGGLVVTFDFCFLPLLYLQQPAQSSSMLLPEQFLQAVFYRVLFVVVFKFFINVVLILEFFFFHRRVTPFSPYYRPPSFRYYFGAVWTLCLEFSFVHCSCVLEIYF